MTTHLIQAVPTFPREPAGRSRPLVFAHRGGAALAPENTLPAFDRALSLGIDGLELDVRLSRDGVVVVHHDRTLARTAGVREAIEDLTAADLATLDVTRHFVPATGAPWRGRPAGVPRLRDVLERYPDVRLIIDLKLRGSHLARAVLAELTSARAIDRVCLGGFSRRPLRAVRASDPHVVTSAAREEVRWLLYRSWLGWSPRRTPYRALQVPETAGRTRVVSNRFVRAAHRAGLPVQVWTVDVPEDIERLLDMGVDGIITDRPDVALAIVQARQTGR